MSLQWTFIATFLYTEIGLVALLMIPFISASRWQKVFRSRLLSSFTYYANIYFNIFIVILVILFFDSIRQVMRFGDAHDKHELKGLGVMPGAKEAIEMKLFRAQRNLYLVGFSLFLVFVLRRLVTLISYQASMEANAEASRKQAESATAAARKLMEEVDNKANEKKGDKEDAAKLAEVTQKLDASKAELRKAQTELDRVSMDFDTMKKQATATNTEYDRLLNEHSNLQAQLAGGRGDKKDD